MFPQKIVIAIGESPNPNFEFCGQKLEQNEDEQKSMRTMTYNLLVRRRQSVLTLLLAGRNEAANLLMDPNLWRVSLANKALYY